jgi:tetrahydromethanopterin S-methyltransferase subunit G
MLVKPSNGKKVSKRLEHTEEKLDKAGAMA